MTDKKLRKTRRNRPETDGPIASRNPTAAVPASRIVQTSTHIEPAGWIPIEGLGPIYPPDRARDKIFQGEAVDCLNRLTENSVACAITSPPYWNLVDYAFPGQLGGSSYDHYRQSMLEIFKGIERVLQPNGKFCLNVPVMPLKKSVSAQAFGKTHTRMLLDLPGDLKLDILENTNLRYYSIYIWEKQTTEKMFGSYPYPPNLLERNYCEFILVFVKPGKPQKMDPVVKEAARMTSPEWMELTKQIWWMYPSNVKRAKGHPSPFPEALPSRLISMYTFPRVPGVYEGDTVLDPLCGWGTACVAAKRLGRRFVGIDLSPEYCAEAVSRTNKVQLFSNPKITWALRPKEKQPE